MNSWLDAFESFPIPCCLLDEHGQIENCNQPFRELTCGNNVSITGEPLASYLRPFSPIQDVLAASSSRDREVTSAEQFELLSSALQGAVPVKVHLTRVEADHSTRFLLTFTDISSEVAAQKELEQQSRRLELASEGGGVGLYTLDLSTNLVTANAKYRELHEIPNELYPDSFPNKLLRDRVFEADRAALNRAVKARDDSDSGRFSFEVRLDLPQKGIRHVFISCTKSTDSNGQAVVHGAVVDVTDLRRTELRLRDELAKQEQIFAIIGHELRTPAAALKMLIDEQKVAEQRPHGEVIVDTIDHLLRVLDDMRLVTNPNLVLDSPEIRGSVPDIVEKSLPLVGRLIVEKGINVSVEASEHSRTVCIVREQLLRQIVLNLVKNAALHAKATELRIGIDSEDLGSTIRFTLEFADNGVGIRREDQTGIFEAFQRGDTQADGTGLGLHISRNYAQQMFHGDLTYRDNTPQGAIFTLTAEFPKKSLSLEQNERAAAQVEASDIFKGKRVLFAEDSPVLRMTTVKQLEVQGAKVLVAGDGREALEIAERESFDLVITDIFMPNMDGYGLTRALRERGFTGPIIGISAAVVGNETQSLIESGASATLPKPLVMRKLKQLVAEISTT